jgi:RNA polymerase sigma-70 factor (ECF subfamily)
MHLASIGTVAPPAPPPAPAALDADALLVCGLQAGDEKAVETLVRQHGPRMHAVIRRILRDEAEAADALQEAFIAAYRSIGGFTGGCRLGTWLHRIAVNAALMRLRTRARRPETSIEELLPGFEPDGHQSEPATPWRADAHRVLEREETRALVRRCVDELPESYRTVLLLRDIEQLDTEETATLLGVNANVVKVRLHRARQALRTLLDPHLSGVRT